jgi:diguanylate cyclase (GGDEF)-like protein
VSKKGTGGDEGSRSGNGGESTGGLNRLEEVAADHDAAASDQSAADADQTASDADQIASDRDSEGSLRDQRASDRDQRASDRDQAVSDHELAEHPGAMAQAAHDANLAERGAGTRERRDAGESRAIAAEGRARAAEQRDLTARHRDITAQARDGAADRRDRESARIERKMASRGSALRTALAHASEIRALAAEDRARAAEDRAQAAADRQRAAAERAAALNELRQAHRDELTGAFRRGPGEEALEGEIERARRHDGRLVLAFVDVDGLREVNNRHGHLAGDTLLCEVVSAIRSKLRSYEPIVRFGGDEFLCAVAELDLEQVERRFSEVRAALAATGDGAAVSVGLAELRREDRLADLIERADAALLDSRKERRGED